MSETELISSPNKASNSDKTQRKSTTYVTYDEIVAIARRGVLIDFANQRAYQLHKDKIREENADVQVIKWTNMNEDKLVRQESTRLIKEHKSALGGAYLYQIGVFGLTAMSAMSTAALLYYGTCYKRGVLIFVPVTTVVTWRLWSIVERARIEEKYMDNAVMMRRTRKDNPTLLYNNQNNKDNSSNNNNNSNKSSRNEVMPNKIDSSTKNREKVNEVVAPTA